MSMNEPVLPPAEDTPDRDGYPEPRGHRFEWRDGRFRLWTVNEVPYGRFPTFAAGGPGMVPLGDWNVAYPRRYEDGKVTLLIRRSLNGLLGAAETHPLHDTVHTSADEARRAAYEAGVMAYVVYLRDEAKYGL